LRFFVPSEARDLYHLFALKDQFMSRAAVFAIYIVIDLLIVAGVVWCVFQRVPTAKFFIPAVILFVLNGVWLVVMTLRTTPPQKR